MTDQCLSVCVVPLMQCFSSCHLLFHPPRKQNVEGKPPLLVLVLVECGIVSLKSQLLECVGRGQTSPGAIYMCSMKSWQFGAK